jgi:hypothetical protein
LTTPIDLTATLSPRRRIRKVAAAARQIAVFQVQFRMVPLSLDSDSAIGDAFCLSGSSRLVLAFAGRRLVPAVRVIRHPSPFYTPDDEPGEWLKQPIHKRPQNWRRYRFTRVTVKGKRSDSRQRMFAQPGERHGAVQSCKIRSRPGIGGDPSERFISTR